MAINSRGGGGDGPAISRGTLVKYSAKITAKNSFEQSCM